MTTTNLGMQQPNLSDLISTDITNLATSLQTIDTEFGLNGTTANRPTTNLYIGRKYYDTTIDKLIQWNGTSWIDTNGLVAQSNISVQEVEITSTSATTVASLTPSSQGNYSVKVYFRVITAATTVTLTVTYTNGSGSQTDTLVNAVSEPIGSYNFTQYINATNATPIAVVVTATTANQVFVSTTIKPE